MQLQSHQESSMYYRIPLDYIHAEFRKLFFNNKYFIEEDIDSKELIKDCIRFIINQAHEQNGVVTTHFILLVDE